MTKLDIGAGALAGALVTAPLIAVLYLADQVADLPFVPFDLFDWMATVLPGPLVTFGLDLMIDALRLAGASVAGTAKTAEKVVSVAQFLMLGVGAGASFGAFFSFRGTAPDRWVGAIAGFVVAIPLILIAISMDASELHSVLVAAWLLLTFTVWGAGIREIYVRLGTRSVVRPVTAPMAEPAAVAESAPRVEPPVRGHDIDRRQFLIQVGATTAIITVAAGGLGSLMAQAVRRDAEAEALSMPGMDPLMSVRPPFPNANDPLIPAPGTRPEYTLVKDHYQVFLRTEPTVIDGSSWSLPITGLVENPVSLTLEDIRDNYSSRDQYITLACISGRVGTDLISTTWWTGASLQEVLADVRPTAGARYLEISSGDGFHETVDLDLISSDERIMLCYAWDGTMLPVDHGFPLRIWLPDRYGMKQPKWITRMEITGEYEEGYWVRRGWDEVAQINTVSVIDTVADDAIYERDGVTFVPVGGMAFAGARGISKVEISVDDGDWTEATLRAPLSETTWVIWRYDWPFEEGRHRFEVRCVDGNGTPQVERSRGSRPSGATGIHRKTARL
jgi:sulfite oxidase